MKIISWNVNGLRSVCRKGFLESVESINPDVICLQEIKGTEDVLNISNLIPPNYYINFNCALKKGYSGVAILSKNEPLLTEKVMMLDRFNNEGRILRSQSNTFDIINLYIPHGGRKKENLSYKIEVYNHLLKYLTEIKDRDIILCGDFNIAHEEIDLARPKGNKNNIMFTPEERDLIDKIISLGFVDSFRKYNPGKVKYSWWPYYANARERNIGWRIDYIFTSSGIKVNEAFILNEILGSDHCPIGVIIDK